MLCKNGICEILWTQGLLRELGLRSYGPISLYCENKTASIAHNPVQHDKTKHIEVDRDFIKEKLQNEHICVPFVKTGD